MRKIIIYITAIILLAILSNSVHAQSFGNVGRWDIYSIPAGRVIFGAGDKTTKPDSSAALELRGRKRALYLRGVVSRDSVYSPKPGMIVMDSTDFHIYFRSVSSWIRLDSIGGGSAPDSSIFLTVTDAAAAYTPLARTLTINGTAYDLSANRTWTIPGTDTTSLSDRINLKENTANKSGTISASSTLFPTHNAVIAYVTGQGYLTAEVDGSTTNEIELPTQTGHGGEYLTTNGTSPSWAAVAAPATPTWQATLTAGNSATSDAITTGYLRASAFHVQNPTAKNVITSGASVDRANTMPDADGTIALIAQTVTNGVTTSCPSQDAVYDYVAANIPAASGWSFISTTGSTNNSSSNITLLTPGASKTFTARIVYQGRSASNRVYSGALFVVGTTNGLNTVTITGQSTTSAAVSSFSGAVSANLNTSGPDLILAVSTVTADGAVTWSVKGDYIIQP